MALTQEMLARLSRGARQATPYDNLNGRPVQGRIPTESHVRHQFFAWWPDQTFGDLFGTDGEEFVYAGNRIYVPNICWPYNNAWSNNALTAYITFNNDVNATPFSFTGTPQTPRLDTRVIHLQGGTTIERDYERFRLYVPSLALFHDAGDFFTDANYALDRSTGFMLYYGFDLGLDMSSYRASTGAFAITYTGTLPVASAEGEFEFRVPYGLNSAELHVHMSPLVNSAEVLLIKHALNQSDEIEEATLTFPISAFQSQQVGISELSVTDSYIVRMTAGGAGETGVFTVTLIWWPSMNQKAGILA
jgi:hypothetical protein